MGRCSNIIHFNKNYRTTAEIMNVADDVVESIGFGRSDIVIRKNNKYLLISR